jgi:hypothetical protein
MVQVTTKILTPPTSQAHEQWNQPASVHSSGNNPITLQYDEDSRMGSEDNESEASVAPPRTTWHSSSTRYFITQTSGNSWQQPPNSKSYRERHPAEARPSRPANDSRYIEVPPFVCPPYTTESVPGGNSGASGARPWHPTCSIVMWCTQHNTFYEVHILS